MCAGQSEDTEPALETRSAGSPARARRVPALLSPGRGPWGCVGRGCRAGQGHERLSWRVWAAGAAGRGWRGLQVAVPAASTVSPHRAAWGLGQAPAPREPSHGSGLSQNKRLGLGFY